MKLGPYTKEFKDNIIRLHFEQKRTIRSLSKEFDISESTISRWIIIHRNTFAINKHAAKEGNDE